MRASHTKQSKTKEPTGGHNTIVSGECVLIVEDIQRLSVDRLMDETLSSERVLYVSVDSAGAAWGERFDVTSTPCVPRFLDGC